MAKELEDKEQEIESFDKDFGFLPIPKRLRYQPNQHFHFGLFLNVFFGIASTFTAANLYYCQPILVELATSFGITYNEVSRIPTLVQAGYATGLLFITPLGDLVRRRQIILLLNILSAALTIGLAVTSSFTAFGALSFLVGVFSVTPQIVLPLAADLAPPERRASALSIVLSGLLFGILIARVLSGIITEFASWRVVYYMAIGLQYLLLVGCYYVIPDYPRKNKNLTYWNVLFSLAKYAVTEPILIQACLINMVSSACFSSFWVTLTFLLSESPYNYSTSALPLFFIHSTLMASCCRLVIGLFGLLGMGGVAMAPVAGRAIDRLVPWYGTLIATVCSILFQAIQVGAGGINIGAVIVVTIGIDVFRQTTQVSVTTSALSISSSARSRLNAVLILSIFIGQVMGTAVGTKVFVQHGWRAAAGLSLAWYATQLVFLLVRGPHCERYTWFGWEGGAEPNRSVVDARKKEREAQQFDIEQGTEKDAKKPAVQYEGDKKKASSADDDETVHEL
ncbi:major facilitator superfamily domain-containing protein [Amanita rubescens]|nr:major facilitator superfamily domain-containing protein [Amanita rubescens]